MGLSSFLGCCLGAAALAGVVSVTGAGPAANGGTPSGIEAARQRGSLTAGLSYPLPAYAAGIKFRTPESLESTLIEALAARLKLQLDTPKINRAMAARALTARRVDVVLMLIDAAQAHDADMVFLPTGYSAGAMAIMRSDTDIKRWEQLRGRTVCLSEGGAYVGKMAAQYGAIEKLQRAPADALLSLRSGACDAAVHDDTMLNDLLTLPEWQKFSARLPAQSRQTLMFGVRAGDTVSFAYLQQLVADWAASGFLAKLKKNWVHHVAFEVYLDQNVPDCH